VQGARLVGSVADVLQALGDLGAMRCAGAAAAADGAGEQPGLALPPGRSDDGPLLQALGFEPVGLDALQVRCGWPTERLQARLLELELEGALGRLPGGLFQRVV
jgi:DNA processing protein